MDDAAQDLPRELQLLGEIAEVETALAKEAYRRAMAAEETKEFEACSRVVARHTRSVRMSIALRDQLIRSARRDLIELPPKRDNVRIVTRRETLRTAMRRVIWTEQETERRDWLWLLLDDQLDNQHLPDDWGTEPLDAQVLDKAAAYDLSLEAARTWRDLPDPPAGHAPDPDALDGYDEEDEDEDEDDREESG